MYDVLETTSLPVSSYVSSPYEEPNAVYTWTIRWPLAGAVCGQLELVKEVIASNFLPAVVFSESIFRTDEVIVERHPAGNSFV